MHRLLSSAINVLLHCCSIVYTINLQDSWWEANKANKGFSFTVVWEYFKNNMQASRIFITSLIIMATGFSYTTLVPVLVHDLSLARNLWCVNDLLCCRWYDCNTFTTHNFEKVHHCTNVLFKFLSIWISACRCHYT